MSTFKDRVIIITGASEGIGRALCLELSKQKPKLVLAARNENRLKSLKDEIQDNGAEALIIPTDVTDESQCENLIQQTIKLYDRLDVLVNNAGQTMWARFDEIKDLSIYEKLMKLNYLGSVYCTYYALPYLKKSKGRIVAVSSVAGLTGIPTRTGYCASKHAMMGFFDSLRIELLDTGVSVTTVAPDWVVSEIRKRALNGRGNPLGESPIEESKVMTAAECAKLLIGAMDQRSRLLITSNRGKIGRYLKIVVPRALDWIAKKAIDDPKYKKTI